MPAASRLVNPTVASTAAHEPVAVLCAVAPVASKMRASSLGCTNDATVPSVLPSANNRSDARAARVSKHLLAWVHAPGGGGSSTHSQR